MRIIGIAGSVASGKTTYANALADELRAEGRSVEIVSTDGYIYPLAELEARGLLQEKGSPRTHDVALLRQSISAARAGSSFEVPLYSHQTYDRLIETRTVHPGDILLFEGVGVASLYSNVADISDGHLDASFDELIYMDTPLEVAFQRYLQRVEELLRSAKNGATTLPPHFTGLDESAALKKARQLWESVNLPNFHKYIEPLRGRADRVC